MKWSKGPRTQVGSYWLFRPRWGEVVLCEVYVSTSSPNNEWWGIRHMGTDEDDFHAGLDDDWFLGPLDTPVPPKAD